MKTILGGTELDSKGRSGIRVFVALEELLNQGFAAPVGGAVIGFINAEVFLIYFGVGMIVGVFVALAVVELLGSGVMAVAEMARNRNGSIVFDVGDSGPNGHGRGVRFFGGS